MKLIGSNSKKGGAWIRAWENSNMHDVYDAYKKPSDAKIGADRLCQDLCRKECGWAYRIICANNFTFTAMWRTSAGWRVETSTGAYLIVLR